AATVEGVRRRLEAAGIATQTQEGTVCGYARQNKCWVADPDRNFWEVYGVEEDVEPAAVCRTLDGPAAPATAPAVPAAGAPSLAHPVPQPLPHGDRSVEGVRLAGSFNANLDEGQRGHLVREAYRVLRPGGKILVHGLAADKPFPNGPPNLPGLASMVSRVALQTEPLRALKAAGFIGMQFVKLDAQPWFRMDGVGLREMKVI